MSFENLELFSFKHVAAFPNSSKMALAEEIRCPSRSEWPKNVIICDALFVFPEPDTPVNIIACGLSKFIRRIILLAINGL